MRRTMLQQEMFEQYRDQGLDEFTADMLARDNTESDPDGFRFLSGAVPDDVAPGGAS